MTKLAHHLLDPQDQTKQKQEWALPAIMFGQTVTLVQALGVADMFSVNLSVPVTATLSVMEPGSFEVDPLQMQLRRQLVHAREKLRVAHAGAQLFGGFGPWRTRAS